MSTTSQERARKRRESRTRAIQALGNGVCAHCGCSDIRVLQIDHIHNDGAAEHLAGVKQIQPYRKFIHFGDAYRSKYQVLRANCHAIKTWHARKDEE